MGTTSHKEVGSHVQCQPVSSEASDDMASFENLRAIKNSLAASPPCYPVKRSRAGSGDAQKTTTGGRKVYLSQRASLQPVAITFIPFVGHQRRSCLSSRCSNLEPAMKVAVTLNNTIGAAFLGVVFSCMWVIHNGSSKHYDTLSSPNQPFRNCNRSNTFILHQLSQRLDLPKSLGEYRRKIPWKKF